MKDHNGSSSCLVGCRSHTIEEPTQPDTLDPEIISYFLAPRTSNNQDSETVSAPQQDGNTQDNETVSTFRRKRVGRHFRNRSSEKSPKSPNSAKSGDSRHSKISKRRSIDSSLSASSRYPRIPDWSAGVSATSPSSFGPPQRNPVDPPRPPKPGYEWVWFPEGYWAEREIRGFLPPSHVTKQKWWNRSVSQNSQIIQKSQTIPKAANEDNVNDNKIPSSFIPQIKIGSVSLKSITLTSQRTSRHTSGDSQKSSNLWRFSFSKLGKQEEATESAQQREGLYRRAKRNIEARFRKMSVDRLSMRSLEGPGTLASRTTILLHGASNYFDLTQRRSNRHAEISPSHSLGSRSRPRLGIAPWHRRHSHDSVLSVSSSVRSLLLGKTPTATPTPEKHYAGHNGKTYPTVQLASDDPHEPTFLPSEARRVNTPPLCPGSPDVQPRGFFFDVNAPDDMGPPVHSPHTSAELGGPARSSPPPSRQWWEGDAQHANTGNKSTHSPARSPPSNLMSPTIFELNLPEHLPSSPLCPKSPKHQSGGTGVCLYHGRRKSVGLKQLRRASTAKEESSAMATER